MSRPVHLDEGVQGACRDVAAQPEPSAVAGPARVEAEQPAHGRVQPVGRDQVARRLAVDQHVVVVRRATGRPAAARRGTPASATAADSAACSVGTPYAAPGPALNARLDAGARAVEVADPAQRWPCGSTPRPAQRGHARRASAPRRRPCRPAPARGSRTDDVEARRGRRAARWPARPVRRRRPRGRARTAAASRGRVASAASSHADPHGQQRGVGDGEHDRGEPGGVHERQRDPLDDDGDVVGVREEAVGPAVDRRQARARR